MRLIVLAGLVVATTALTSPTTTRAEAAGQKWYEKAVKKIDATVTPAEAKPGQTVTFTLTVELNDGYYTYPTAQTDKGAAGMVNVLKFPAPDTVIFVGSVQEGKNLKTKAEPELKIQELRYYEGVAVFTRKAVVSPKAPAGPTTVKLKSFELSVCDKFNCFPSKDVPVSAVLKVLDGLPVPVEKEYADEVAKALGGK